MPVTTTHPNYNKYIAQWRKIRTAMEGEDDVKAAGTTYLPKPLGQTDAEYNAYKMRAMFLNAAGRTVTGLTGAILRKPPSVDIPPDMEEPMKALGNRGESLESLLGTSVEEDIAVGRIGFLVDAARQDELSDESAIPYVSTYFAESIIHWEEGMIDGRKQLIRVVLRETRTVRDERDDFVTEEQVFYRVLFLDVETEEDAALGDVSGSRIYRQQIWVPQEGSEEDETPVINFVLEEIITPTMAGGRTLTEIPFVFINPTDTDPDASKPPMLDLVNVNFSHYRNSADLEHGRHLTALPTPWASGFSPKSTNVLPFGSNTAWISENENAKFGMMEFTGRGLGHLASGMEHKEGLMAMLGARLLEDQPSGVEAAETVKLRHSGEHSALSNISITVSEAWTKLLKLWADWVSKPFEDIKVTMNKDFNPIGMDPKYLTSLMAALQAGTISWNTWFHNLQRGEVTPEGLTEEQEFALIGEGLPDQPPAESEEGEAVEEERTTGETDGHTHTYSPGDSQTGTSDGHTHPITQSDGQVIIGEANGHTHSA